MLIESVKEDLISLLTQIIPLYESYKSDEISALSNHIIHSASVYQDSCSIKAAIIIYSLGKVMAKGKDRHYPKMKWASFKKVVGPELRRALQALKNNNEETVMSACNRIEQAIQKLDESFMRYTEYVIDKAKLNKGVKMYEHGVSMKKVAELLGVSEWDLMQYSGKTKIIDRDVKKSIVKKRFDNARRLIE